MELRHLRYFLAVAQELHFGRAAARLHISQPPLSLQIRQLEEELGIRLFHRTKRRVQLTEAGQTFLEGARLTLAQAARTILEAQLANKGQIGRLAIGFVGSALYGVFPPILRRFRECFPSVGLTLEELNISQQMQALDGGHIHVGFIRPPIDNNTLSLEVVSHESLVAVLPASFPTSHQPRVPIRALRKEDLILFPRRLGPDLYDEILSICHKAGFSPRITQEAISLQTIIELVAAGMGVSILPASVQNLQRKGVVYRLLRPEPRSEVQMAVAWKRDNRSTVLEAFLTVVREVVRRMKDLPPSRWGDSYRARFRDT